MTDELGDDLNRRLRGLDDDLAAVSLPGPDAARKRGRARTRHQAIGGTFAAAAAGAVAAVVLSGQPSLLAGPDPAEPAPLAIETSQPASPEPDTPERDTQERDTPDPEGLLPTADNDWERLSLPEELFSSPSGGAPAGVVADDGAIVVLGLGPILRSPDGGDTWRRVADVSIDNAPAGATSAGFIDDAARSDDGTLVAVGRADAGGPLALRSTDDGRTWTGTVIETARGHATAVAWTGEEFVAVGGLHGPAAWRSEDGGQWTRLSRLSEETPSRGAFGGVAAGPEGRVVAHGGLGASASLVTWQAADASDWRATDLPADVDWLVLPSTHGYANIEAGPDSFYELEISAGPDGLEWERRPGSEHSGGLADTAFITSDGRTVVGGRDGGRGALWIAPTPGGPLEQVAEQTFRRSDAVLEVVEGPDGLIAFAASRDGSIVAWRETGR